MTIAGKINALVLVITALLGTMAAGFTAVREFRLERDLVVDKTVALVSSQPDLQADIYFRDMGKLQQTLGRFLQPQPVAYAVLYDTNGRILAQRDRVAGALTEPPPFELLRRDVAATETGERVFNAVRGKAGGQGLLNAVLSKDSMIQLTFLSFHCSTRCLQTTQSPILARR